MFYNSCDRGAIEIIGGMGTTLTSSVVCDRSAIVLLGVPINCDRSAIISFSCDSSAIGVIRNAGRRLPTSLVCDRSAIDSIDCDRSAKIGVVSTTCDRSAMVCVGLRL